MIRNYNLKIFLVIWINLFIQDAYSQTKSNSDSLFLVWADDSYPDTSRLKAISTFIWDNYLFKKPDSAFYFAQLEYDFAEEAVLYKYKTDALNAQGISLSVRGENDSALLYFHKVLEVFEENDDENGISTAHNNLGNVYWRQGNNDQALAHFNKSLSIGKRFVNKASIARLQKNMAMIYKEQGRYDLALENLNNSLKLREELNNKVAIAGTLSSIGNIIRDFGEIDVAIDYFNRSLAYNTEEDNKLGIAANLGNLATCYRMKGDYEKALDLFRQSLEIKESIQQKVGVAISLSNIGVVYFLTGDYDNALDYHQRSLKLREEMGSKQGMADSYNNLGKVYHKRGDYNKAIEYHNKALSIARELDLMSEIRAAAKALYELNKANGNTDMALEMHELYILSRDSIDSEENLREVYRQEYKYNYEKKALADSIAFENEQKNMDAQLKRSRTFQYALVSGIILLIVFLTFIYNRFRLIQKQKSIISNQHKEIETALKNLKAAQSQLIQSEKMASLGLLTAGIAHEMNNPVNYILTSSLALKQNLNDIFSLIAKYKEYTSKYELHTKEIEKFEKSIDLDLLLSESKQGISNIEEGAYRTTEIIKGMKEYSYVSDEITDYADIHHCIDTTLKLLKSRFTEQVKLIEDYDQSISQVKCNIGQMSQVFVNLFANALDAIEDNGTITVITKKQGNSILISIKDDGYGIPQGILEKIFDPFFTTKKNGHGTGLGLYISYGIIKGHGGTITVKSSPGKETVFNINIPIT